MSRKVVVEGTGMSLSERFGAVGEIKKQAKRNVVNTQPSNSGIQKRQPTSPNTARSLNQFRGNGRTTTTQRGGRQQQNSFQDTRVSNSARGGRGAARGGRNQTQGQRGQQGQGRGAKAAGNKTGRGAKQGDKSARGKGRGGQTKKKMTAEDLDKELTKYMLKDEKIGSAMLDQDLDEYMAQRDAAVVQTD